MCVRACVCASVHVYRMNSEVGSQQTTRAVEEQHLEAAIDQRADSRLVDEVVPHCDSQQRDQQHGTRQHRSLVRYSCGFVTVTEGERESERN